MHGREFALVAHTRTWLEGRVYYEDGAGRTVSIPARWTDVEARDPYLVVAAGRSYFRVADLVELTYLLAEMGQ